MKRIITNTELFRIDNNKYYVSNEYTLEEVSRDKFIEELKRCDWLKNCYDKKVVSEYNEMIEFLEKGE